MRSFQFLQALITTSIFLVLTACEHKNSSANNSLDESGSSSDIQLKINQMGFLPTAQKLAVISAQTGSEFSLTIDGTDTQVFQGRLSEAVAWSPAKESVQIADFSSLTTAGVYRLHINGELYDGKIRIAGDIYRALNNASVKAFYFNRASTALLEEHAGIYTRGLGHPDTQVHIHTSASSALRPAGTIVSAPKGWYDAGDYNKYVVNSGISTYTLLAAYEHFPDYYQKQLLNIPESGDAVPDILDEVRWNLEWLLAMQDPADGGVYHKLTAQQFAGYVMPAEAIAQRYMVQKSTAAALNFAAVMAVASRVFADFETQFPGVSVQYLAAAESAWQWAKANPAVYYSQPDDIKTGEYGDTNLSDEFAWAAAELYITTLNDGYYAALNRTTITIALPAWADVRGLAWISLAQHRNRLTSVANKNLIIEKIETLAAEYVKQTEQSAYRVGMLTNEFHWGSNSVVLNKALMLIQAYRINNNRDYLNAAQSKLDYVLGRNATGYSFVTGFGEKTPMHIHHRVSQADGIAEPIPGFLVGGPQPGQQDSDDCPVDYPSSIPAKSYLDHVCSYASNEVAINWNAPLVYVTGAIHVLTLDK